MKTAVVLFNLGGPDDIAAVRPFLFNLFSDPAIFRLPAIARLPLAFLVSRLRTKKAVPIYQQLGGGSPILPNTEKQATALQECLGDGFKTFIAMRYWQPRAIETALAVSDYKPDKIVLLPLYPQYSTTTTASSLKEWYKVARQAGLHNIPTSALCCYPTDEGFIAAQVQSIKTELDKIPNARVLFSAHGLPEKVVADGDPYQWQCEQTAKALANELGLVDWVNCYQSRVGPLQWIGPSTAEEIERAGREKKSIIIVPMSFVSEHSETLVELDIDYKNLAAKSGVPQYGRAATVMAANPFIQGLAAQVRKLVDNKQALCSHVGVRICPYQFKGCPIHP
jgi:protoporphyrin/coproporphyrin ferrochelatase